MYIYWKELVIGALVIKRLIRSCVTTNNSVFLKGGGQIISGFFTTNFWDGSYSQVLTLDFMALIHLDIGQVILTLNDNDKNDIEFYALFHV